MWEDPIVAEVREIREKLAAKFGFEVKAIFADLRRRQGSLGGRLVPQKKKYDLTADAEQLPDCSPAELTPPESVSEASALRSN